MKRKNALKRAQLRIYICMPSTIKSQFCAINHTKAIKAKYRSSVWGTLEKCVEHYFLYFFLQWMTVFAVFESRLKFCRYYATAPDLMGRAIITAFFSARPGIYRPIYFQASA